MRASVIAALLCLASCGGGTTTNKGHWQMLGDQRPSALLGVWASSTQDVWVVGGREAAGMGPSVFHYDGTMWNKLDTGLVDVDLWVVFGFANDAVYLGGSNGTILRYKNGAFEKLPTPTTDIVFGLWGSTPDDVWAVGGQPTGNPFVWHYQNAPFAPVSGLPADLTLGAVWKVTGRAADDVWMSASQDYVLHWDGSALSSETLGGGDDALFSIGCHASGCVTVGTNFTNGVLYQDDGQGWMSRVPTEDGPVWRGVTPTGEHVAVVGQFGAVLQLTNNAWASDPQDFTTQTLHAVWSDADGNVFAVGGQFDSTPTTDGVLIFKGATDLGLLP